MHVSPISEPEDDPYVATTHTWLMLLLLPEFCTLCYLNDLVKLSCTSRIALEPAVVEQLSLMDHLVKEWGYWKDDWVAERHAELELEEFYRHHFPDLLGEDTLCLSCGLRPGCDWLCSTECYECYDEH